MLCCGYALWKSAIFKFYKNLWCSVRYKVVLHHNKYAQGFNPQLYVCMFSLCLLAFSLLMFSKDLADEIPVSAQDVYWMLVIFRVCVFVKRLCGRHGTIITDNNAVTRFWTRWRYRMDRWLGVKHNSNSSTKHIFLKNCTPILTTQTNC